MLIRDNESPRGRDLGPHRTFEPSMLKTLGGTYTEDFVGGWTGASMGVLFDKRPLQGRNPYAARRPRPSVTTTCQECQAEFSTPSPSIARFCGGTCKKRAWRRAHPDRH